MSGDFAKVLDAAVHEALRSKSRLMEDALGTLIALGLEPVCIEISHDRNTETVVDAERRPLATLRHVWSVDPPLWRCELEWASDLADRIPADLASRLPSA